MSKKVLSLLFFILIFSFHKNIFSTVKGSESSVSVEPAYMFPAADADNKMLGFGWFKSGFSLEDNTTTCTFDSVYPVSGDIDLNGGTLCLSQDLILKNVTTILGFGNIFGNNHLFEFCSSINQLPAGAVELQDIVLSLNSDLLLTDTVMFKGNCKIFGNGWSVNLGDDGYIIVDSNARVHFSDVIIHGVTSDNFVMTDDTSELILENSKWLQSGHYNFTHGSILFLDDVDFIGSYTFHYDSKMTSTIDEFSTLSITREMCFELGRKDSIDDEEPLYFQNTESALRLDSCSIVITGSGSCLKTGKIEVDRDVQLEIIGTTTSTGLVLGTGVESQDFTVHLNAGAALHFLSGQLVYNNYRSDRLTALSESARITRYAQSKMHIARDWIFPPMVLKVDSATPETIVKDGVTFSYDKSKIVFGGVEYDFSGNQSGSYDFFLSGNDYLYLSKGTFANSLLVSGDNNKIYGTGNFTGGVYLQDSDTELSLDLNGLIVEDINLAGGKAKLEGDLALGADAIFSGAGTVDLSSYNFNLSGLDSTWTSTILWQSNGGGISLNSKACLLGKWEFDDSCIINGNGHTIDMVNEGQIVVKDGVCLTLRNVILHTVSQSDIQLETDDSCLILDSVMWLQDSHVMFDKGSIKFLNDVDFRGSYSFVYESSRTSTIAANSKWKITKDMVLRIGRKEAENYLEPLYFENQTSTLRLDDCSFVVTGSGMQILGGMIEIDRDVNFDIIGTTTTNGLIVGSGINSEEDTTIKVFPGAALYFRTGVLVYNNSSPDKIVAMSESARFICYGPSRTHIAKDCTFPEMVLKLTQGIAETTLEDGVNFGYNNTHFELFNVEFNFTGKQYCTTIFNLEGGNLLYLTKGNFVLPIAVSGPTNYLWGTGNISGPIILQDSDASLSCDLSGILWGQISLNDSTLELGGDLFLGGDYAIGGSGQVCLMRYNVVLGSQDSVWTSTLGWHSNGTCPCPYDFPRGIDLHSKLNLSGKWDIQDKCMINGNGHMLDLGENGVIEVQEGTKLTLRNLVLRTSGENNVYCLEDNSSIVFDNVTWIQDSHFTFTKGSMRFENNVDFIGSYSFVYDSARTSTITKNAHWTIAEGLCLRMGRKEAENYVEPLCFEDSTSTLRFDNCSLVVTGSGMQVLGGIVEMDRSVILDIIGTATTNGLIFGSGTEAEDTTIKVFPGAALHFRTGMLVYNNSNPNGIVALSDSARFICYGPSITHIARDCVFPEMILKMTEGIPETTLEDGANFMYNNTRFVLFNAEFEFTGKQYHAMTFNLEGNDLLYLTKGNFILATVASGADNYLWGTGNIAGPIFLQDSDTSLMFDFNGNINSNITMNGGTIILNDDLSFTSGNMPVGSGVINLAGNKLGLGAKDLGWSGSTKFNGTAGSSIDIRSKVDLLSTWTFLGACIVDGHGNTIDLSNEGNILVGEGAKVTFRDVRIIGISENNIRCLDDDGVIVLEDTVWVQDNDYSFATGALEIKKSVKMEGIYEFSYETQMTSTILRDSSWKFGIGSTLDYDPIVNSKDLIEFYDDTSYMSFHSSYLHTNTNGMNFKKGNLVIKGLCGFSSDILRLEDDTILNEGIIIGSGTEVDDCIFKIAMGSLLNVSAGALKYNNVATLSFFMENRDSILKIMSGAEFILNQDLTLADGLLYICDGAFLDIASGKNIIGSVSFAE